MFLLPWCFLSSPPPPPPRFMKAISPSRIGFAIHTQVPPARYTTVVNGGIGGSRHLFTVGMHPKKCCDFCVYYSIHYILSRELSFTDIYFLPCDNNITGFGPSREMRVPSAAAAASFPTTTTPSLSIPSERRTPLGPAGSRGRPQPHIFPHQPANQRRPKQSVEITLYCETINGRSSIERVMKSIKRGIVVGEK